MIRKLIGIFLVILTILNIIFLALGNIPVLLFWINLFILFWISHFFNKNYEKKIKKEKLNKRSKKS